ncbi:hypothetical protein AGABI2DRAFT_187221 [Agaricus bisporus var. bisporus H97]|uniref:hypothetical protein n=1 Tax=Agaricus bisporus var. bisporus (strain H97 / ATCC MYA-4626 / FGSC 10389) TaxID=936046 RepID=UPI00029F5646|nr:hypothetical protein AGABI2DRAFT_187221 [Agaricus bisporus var. bisporus H97]EKV44378.1 hypothetical protein AGABI2DRAFT_187221 [Agaricus bisporus var. bisporus H97]
MPVPVDPLEEVLKPPPEESPEERLLRLQREEQARQVSAAIDATIKAERNACRKKRIVRLLLLGQSESGKSTTLRQFQRLYTPTAFREERILWRSVIQLNIVRSIRTILDALLTSSTTSLHSSFRSRSRSVSRNPPPLPDVLGVAEEEIPSSSSPRHHPHRSGATIIDSDGDVDSDLDLNQSPASASRSTLATRHRHRHSDTQMHLDRDCSPPRQNNNYYHYHKSSYQRQHIRALKSRLSPIRDIEQRLIGQLVPPDEEEATHLGNGNLGGNGIHYTTSTSMVVGSPGRGDIAQGEVFVRPTTMWRGALARARVTHPAFFGDGGSASSDSSGESTGSGGVGSLEYSDDIQETLNALCADMVQLWEDPNVRGVLKRQKIKLEEGSGFFLNDLKRVTSPKFIPSDDDVLKARLKTVGVAEYRFEMEVPMSRDTGTEWRIVDVGGSRSQVITWVPFFDDVDAIIFLAPISSFDQVLTEDRTVNRLEDSVLLWKAVCSNKLLANVDLVLFLNKCDILDHKLRSGIRLSKYVRSYADRENNLDTVSKYMRSKFGAIQREHSPIPRKFYAFCTSVTDTATTAGIIASVRDMVIRQYLRQSKFL